MKHAWIVWLLGGGKLDLGSGLPARTQTSWKPHALDFKNLAQQMFF